MNRDEGDIKPLPGLRREQHKPAYQFSPEELRVLKECNRESFFQRCLPLGTFLGATTYLGVKNGYLAPNPRYGPTPKVIVAVVVGYFLGKISYQGRCAEKLMQLPNSQIGEMLRQRRKGIYNESLDPGFGPGMSLAPFSNVNPSDTYTDLTPSTDLDTSRPDFDGLDDSHRPTIDNPIYEEEMPPIQNKITTYEELRRKNREEYQQRRTSSYREPLRTPTSTQTTDDDYVPPQRIRTNKYGDSWE